MSIGIDDRFKSVDGDFFDGALPSTDVVVMGNVLHDWDEDTKEMLVSKAYDAVAPGGSSSLSRT